LIQKFVHCQIRFFEIPENLKAVPSFNGHNVFSILLIQEFVHTKVSFFEIPQNNLKSGLIVGCLIEIDVALG